jgi:hypothetical protein
MELPTMLHPPKCYRFSAEVLVFFLEDVVSPVVYRLEDQVITAESLIEAHSSLTSVIWETVSDLGSDMFDAPPDYVEVLSTTWHDRNRIADRVDGFDRDDLGLSPDF